MLNDKQVSTAGRFKDISKNIIFIGNKKHFHKCFLFPIFVIVYLKLSFTYLITSLSFYKMIISHICSVANICYVFLYTFHCNFRQGIYDMLIYIFFKKHTPYVLLPCYKNFGMIISIWLSYYTKKTKHLNFITFPK